MSNEPVAYINVEERKLEWAAPVVWNTGIAGKANKVPLYTRQYRYLTDEEIVHISETCDLNHVLGLIDFARAILQRAIDK
jgi:hypothetical protein